jgi:WD40 repeat protein
MAVWLIATLLALVTSDGCSPRLGFVNSLEFSPDGKELVFASHTARNANVSFKAYRADVSRAICVLDVESGAVRDIERETKEGNQGPASHLFRAGRKSVTFGLAEKSLIVHEFGGGDVFRIYPEDGGRDCTYPKPRRDVLNISSNSDRTKLAAGHLEGFDLWDAHTVKRILKVETSPDAFIHAPLMAFSADSKIIAATGGDLVRFWSTEDGAEVRAPIRFGKDVPIKSLTMSPCGNILAIGSQHRLLERF